MKYLMTVIYFSCQLAKITVFVCNYVILFNIVNVEKFSHMIGAVVAAVGWENSVWTGLSNKI